MKQKPRTVHKHNLNKINCARPVLEISPINRNFPNDDLVVREISVNSKNADHAVKKEKKKKFLLNLSKDDLIILGVIILLFMNRHNDPKDDSYEVNEDTSKCNGLFNLERIKAILPFDKLSDSDILLILMVYLLL